MKKYFLIVGSWPIDLLALKPSNNARATLSYLNFEPPWFSDDSGKYPKIGFSGAQNQSKKRRRFFSISSQIFPIFDYFSKISCPQKVIIYGKKLGKNEENPCSLFKLHSTHYSIDLISKFRVVPEPSLSSILLSCLLML